MIGGFLKASAVALLVAAAVATAAVANDSDAPPGATPRWLPCESWVMYHWLPFSEHSFYRETGIDRAELKHWLYASDRNTIGELVRRHHKDPEAVVAKLLRARQGHVSTAQFAELTRRGEALMTQSHLSQHVFFHLFHDPALGLNSRWIFNVGTGNYQMARMSGWSPSAIARHGGVPVRVAVRRTMSVLRREQNEGVKLGWTTRPAATSFLKRQRAWTKTWLRQDIHIYRKRSFPHGMKAPSGTRAQRACRLMTGAHHERGAHDDV